MKKILSIALALTILLALGVTAFAADKDPVADRTSFIMGIDPEYPRSAISETTETTPALTWKSARLSATCSAGSWKSSV